MGELMLRETQLSKMFPGFKFSPTDEELISYYLKKKIEGSDDCVEVIPEVDLCQFEPWDLPAKSVIQSDSEWFFFAARGRKYPNGLQSKRATESGYWKATGKERNVKSGSNVIGTKRTLVFHKGRAPKGERTEWIMHEYCMSGNSQDSRVVCRLRKNNDFRLNDNPRRVSQNRTGDDNTFGLCEDGIEETGVLEGDKAPDGCNSSYNSQSLEPTDSGSESEQNRLSHPDISSQKKDCDDEEDCFAEIMNDDIIKLDESSLSTIPHLQQAEINSEQTIQRVALAPSVQSVIPIQGTANRRIRLRKVKTKLHRLKSSERVEVGDKTYVHPHAQNPSSMVFKWQCIITISVVLTLLVLFVFRLD